MHVPEHAKHPVFVSLMEQNGLQENGIIAHGYGIRRM
jgi:hypothetical protein